MIQKAQKKPVVIEFVVWDERLATLRVLEKMGMKWLRYEGHASDPDVCRWLKIQALEGPLYASKGDIIIKGVKGEFYPCKPDIFALTYDVLPLAAGGGEG